MYNNLISYFRNLMTGYFIFDWNFTRSKRYLRDLLFYLFDICIGF